MFEAQDRTESRATLLKGSDRASRHHDKVRCYGAPTASRHKPAARAKRERCEGSDQRPARPWEGRDRRAHDYGRKQFSP